MKRLLLLFTFLTFLMPAVWAGVFTSSDGQFTIDMPAGWVTAPDTQAVLGLKKGTAEIIIRTDKSACRYKPGYPCGYEKYRLRRIEMLAECFHARNTAHSHQYV